MPGGSKDERSVGGGSAGERPEQRAPGDGASWAQLVEEAPDLAARVRDRSAVNLHHVLATVRADGAPRLSGTEVAIGDEELTIGMMPASHKLADVRRDPRVELHSAPIEDDLAAGDAKLAGRLAPLDRHGQEEGAFFRLSIEGVSLVQVGDDELIFTTWRPGRGLAVRRRS